MMFPMVLPPPSSSISFGTGPECFLAHAGSASMESGLSAGGFPAKVTVPLTDDAAVATPGQTDITTNPAASHNLFPVTRMLDSLVIAKPRFSDAVDAAPPLEWVGSCGSVYAKSVPRIEFEKWQFLPSRMAGVKRGTGFRALSMSHELRATCDARGAYAATCDVVTWSRGLLRDSPLPLHHSPFTSTSEGRQAVRVRIYLRTSP